MKFQIRAGLVSFLLKKPLMENFIFCAIIKKFYEIISIEKLKNDFHVRFHFFTGCVIFHTIFLIRAPICFSKTYLACLMC